MAAPEPYHAMPTPLPSQAGKMFLSLFPSIMLPMFMAVSDQTIVASALPAIAATLGDVERVSWVVVAYLVAGTIAAPVYGYLGDVFGRRRLMFIALSIFILSSIGCSMAPSINWLTFGRLMQGFGGGGLMSLSQALVGEVVPARLRGHYQGYLAAVATVSSVLGPVLGGFLTDHFGWRSIFLVSVPVGLIAMVLIFRLPSRPGTRDESWSFDFLGLVYFVAFIAPVLLALEQARHFDWESLTIIGALLVMAAGSFVLLIRHENRIPSPLLPLSLFRQGAIWRGNGMAMCHGAALTGLVAFLPIYLRVVRDMSASETGMMLLPVSIGIGLGSITTGRIMARTGRTMAIPTVGLCVSTLSLLGFVFIAPDLSVRGMGFLLTFTALFMGTVMSVVQVTVQTLAGRKLIGAAAGSVQFSRTVGAAFGTALMATILFATLAATDPEAAGLLSSLLGQGTSALAHLDAARRTIVEAEIAFAFRCAFSMLAVFTCTGALLAWTNPARRIG